jgi:DNA-binding transcriptional LysR family regulator
MKSIMDLRHLRTFVAVAELGTVSKASERLRVAQPALSRQIALLEQELGLRLFDRVGRRLVLTGAGEELLGDCRVLLLHATAIGERAQLLRQGDTGVLRIAASPQFIESVLSEFLPLYAREFPNVQVMIVESIIWSDTMAMLERREVHLGQNILSAVSSDNQRLSRYPLEAMELLVAGLPARMRNLAESIELARLANCPLLVLDQGFASRRNFDATCRAVGMEPQLVFESRTPHTLLAMAEAGHGMAIVPSAVRIGRYRLRTARLTHKGRPLREPLALFWEKQRRLPRYAEAFCSMLADHVRGVFPISSPTQSDRLPKERRPRRP